MYLQRKDFSDEFVLVFYREASSVNLPAYARVSILLDLLEHVVEPGRKACSCRRRRWSRRIIISLLGEIQVRRLHLGHLKSPDTTMELVCNRRWVHLATLHNNWDQNYSY